MSTYSYSRLSTFEQCKGKYKFQYVDKVKTEIEQTIEAFLGSRVHEALEKIYISKRFMIVMEQEEVIDYYKLQWEKNWNDSIVIVREGLKKENYYNMGVKYITDFYNRHKPFDAERTVGLETARLVDLDSSSKIHVRIDRLTLKEDGTYEIHDYKTANSLPTQQDVDSDRQLAIYAYGVRKMYPDAKKVQLVWHYLAFDKVMTSKRSPEQLEELRTQIVELIGKIEATADFPYTKSGLCNWCQFQPICPEFAHKFKTEQMASNEYLKEDGVVLVNKYVELSEQKKASEKELEKVKAALVKYAQDNDYASVVGSDVIATIRTYPRLSFPKKDDKRQVDFFDILKKSGLWGKLSTANVYELAKMINSGQVNKDIIRLLEPYMTRSKTDMVYLRKK